MEENLNPDPTNVNPEQNPKPKSNKGLLIIIALMAIVIAGLVGYVVYTDSQVSGEKDSTSSSKEIDSEKDTDEDKKSKDDKKKDSKDAEDEDEKDSKDKEDDEDLKDQKEDDDKKSDDKEENDEEDEDKDKKSDDEDKKEDSKKGFGKKDKETTDDKETTESKDDSKEESKDEPKENTTVTAPVSGDWKSGEFTFDGKSYKINDDYTKFKANGWYIDLSKAGYEDGYILNKNQKVYSTIDFLNDNYKDADVRVGFINLGDKAVDITETQVWAITVDNKYSDTPIDFTLPGGIKNGSTLAEIEAAYGKPTEEGDIYRSEDLGYTTYTYDNDLEPELRLTIWDDVGLTKFEYKIY